MTFLAPTLTDLTENLGYYMLGNEVPKMPFSRSQAWSVTLHKVSQI